MKFCQKIALVAAGLMMGSHAYAADLPVKATHSPMLSPARVATWTGFYVGANVGYGWATVDSNFTTIAGTTSETLNGLIGGGQIGYNWQTGNLVLGLEADIQATGQSKSTSGSVLGVSYSVEDKIPYFGTIRGRVGYALGSWMPYITGGWGYGEFKSSATVLGVTASGSQSHSAWVLGGGLEWMFAPRWSAKLEYLYFDTGDMDIGGGSTTTVHDNIVRVGANYHF